MLEIVNVSHSFGAKRAVDDVSLTIGPGEIVALAGENGAGKTTLMRIVAGELKSDAGTIRLASEEDSQAVGFVHQHFMLVSELSIAENLALADRHASPFTTRRGLLAKSRQIIAESGIDLPGPERRVGDLSVGERAKLELIKAIAGKPRLLILDEPTSVLTPSESEELFRVMRMLAARGTAIVFISHKLPEVLAIARRVVVMRRGRIVADGIDMTAQQIAAAMVPDTRRDAAEPLPPATIERRTILLVQNATAGILRGATLSLDAGELLAIVGVAGNGQGELAEVLRGIRSLRDGRIALDGRDVGAPELRQAARIAHIPEDRTRDGLVAEMSIAENISLTSRSWRPRVAAERAERLIRFYDVRAEGAWQRAGALSGGNQQKVVLARELDRSPEVIIAAEPTRGLDVAASAFVHQQLRAAAARGAAILLITSDLDEAFALATSVQVIYRGTLSARMEPTDAASRVGALMAGIG